jgi:hypothetical protein
MNLNSFQKVGMCRQFRARNVSTLAGAYGPFSVINAG